MWKIVYGKAEGNDKETDWDVVKDPERVAAVVVIVFHQLRVKS